jgi:hypothetical protein
MVVKTVLGVVVPIRRVNEQLAIIVGACLKSVHK